MSQFSKNIVVWQKQHGRHDLPWQNTTDSYAIWVSEIMLQQTQVAAVIAYYAKFMQRFPNIATLANATQEEVLQYWSGLGYYSRARNLHNAAQTIMDDFDGKFPQDFEAAKTLRGIGRSTAAAIVSFAFGQTETILDGNVKRILARHFAIEGWPSSPSVAKQMWALAESLLPSDDMVAYTQGLMDLGATVCTRSKPKCKLCPLNASCIAFAKDQTLTLPTPKPRKAIPEKDTTMLIYLYANEVMLEKRPQKGIWGGLWSLPETNNNGIVGVMLDKRSHAFTHFKLHIQPKLIRINKQTALANTIWLDIDEAINAAIPTPVRKILLGLKQTKFS